LNRRLLRRLSDLAAFLFSASLGFGGLNGLTASSKPVADQTEFYVAIFAIYIVSAYSSSIDGANPPCR
jgi:hypothetical protein